MPWKIMPDHHLLITAIHALQTTAAVMADADACGLIDPAVEKAEMAAIEAESIGWLPLEPGAYLHLADDATDAILVIGVADAALAGINILLAG